MIINEDIWIQIKQFLLRKHLWNTHEVILFNKVMCDIKQPIKPSNTNPNNTNPLIFISSNDKHSRILKIYETLYWKNFDNFYIITYIYLPHVKNAENYIFNTYYPSLKYDMNIC
jgi:hypothetical protein